MICKEKRETDKQLGITRAPQFLVIHFKRFRTGTDRKIAVPIEFPLKNFDLEPYMLPQPSREEADYIAQSYPPEVAKPDSSMLPPYKYDAYAVVRHIGASKHQSCQAQYNSYHIKSGFATSPEVLTEPISGSHHIKVTERQRSSNTSQTPEFFSLDKNIDRHRHYVPALCTHHSSDIERCHR